MKIDLFKDHNLIKEIPTQSGVYIIKSEDDEILYIGKAKSLRDRLKSYLKPSDLDMFKISLVREASSVEIIVVNSELEALLLESNLIKEYRPPYNIVLRDDKSYPYLRISYSEKFPRLTIVRRVKQKGDFYFGPITPVDKLRTLVKLLKSSFKIIQKNDSQCQGSDRACIYYQMGKCTAPCIGAISRDKYLKLIDEIREILTNPSKIKKKLKSEIDRCVEELNFEKAIELRDKLKAIELLENKQTVSEIDEDFCDVVAFAEKDGIVCVYVMSVRFSNITGGRSFFFYQAHIDDEFIESFLTQYYLVSSQVIPDVIITDGLKDTNTLSKAISTLKNVQVIVPKKGKRRKLLEMALKNAKLNLDIHLNQFSENIRILSKLKERFGLLKMPHAIDIADISHINFENVVGGVVRYSISGFDKQMYRRYKLESKYESEAMEEMLSRHKKLLIRSSLKLPDILLVDGGVIQVKAAKRIFPEIIVLGIAKEKKDGLSKRSLGDVADKIYSEEGIIEIDEDLLKFFQKLRDEAHRFAVSYHRKKRKEYVLMSALDRIEFIGPKRKKALFEKFGNIDRLREADIDEIASVKGISRRIAEIIKEKLNEGG
ncbi:excinuclease ABC subunit UvrC [Hippea alviniae]|uniref:excinuclease ABC subunit UvrC n=1 Tax=Hippea alviniae TaxID=1279027 RepID=UPI0003B631DD|nr:excinuclease ABC subunit UvrC [Hippea alviniae]